MKIIAVGDVHGDSTWKSIDSSKYDKIVFMGDYVDDFTNTTENILLNLQDIIEFKKKNMEKVILLLGNHDIQYILWNTCWFNAVICTGFQRGYLSQLNRIFLENEQLFQVAYQIQNYLFTHAGLSEFAYDLYIKEKDIFEREQLALTLNTMWTLKNEELFHIGYKRGGFSGRGSIFWADAEETMRDPLIGYRQIIGHTPVEKVTVVKESPTSEDQSDTSITYIDTRLGNQEFYEFEIEEKDNE